MSCSVGLSINRGTWPRSYKPWVHFQTQNKKQWLAGCGHKSASSQSLRFFFSLRLCSSFITSRPGWSQLYAASRSSPMLRTPGLDSTAGKWRLVRRGRSWLSLPHSPLYIREEDVQFTLHVAPDQIAHRVAVWPGAVWSIACAGPEVGDRGSRSPLKIHSKYRVSYKYWPGSPKKSQGYQASIKCWAIIGTPAKCHFNGVSLAGKWWSAYSGIWILPRLINLKKRHC